MQVIWVTSLHRLIIDREIAHEDAGIGARDALHGRAGALEAFEHNFEQFALLWVHVRCLEVVDAEEAVVELTDVLFEEIASGNIHGASTATIGVIERVDVVTLRRDSALSGLFVHHQVPEAWG